MSDRGADSEHVVGVELHIVLDVVVVKFGPEKEVVPKVVANTGAKVFHEVIAARVVNASDDRVAARIGVEPIEARAGNTDAAHKIEANFAGDMRLVEKVESTQEGAVGFTVIRIDRAAVPPGGFDLKTQAVPGADNIPAQADVAATFLWRLLETYRVVD